MGFGTGRKTKKTIKKFFDNRGWAFGPAPKTPKGFWVNQRLSVQNPCYLKTKFLQKNQRDQKTPKGLSKIPKGNFGGAFGLPKPLAWVLPKALLWVS